MKRAQKPVWNRNMLLRYGVPAVLIPGMLLAFSLGFAPKKFEKFSSYYQNRHIFPESGMVREIVDGDTFGLDSGVEVRLLGINAPGRGEEGYAEASKELAQTIRGKRVYLEYDRYQDDKYGRVLAWVWVDCEETPVFLPPEYMHASANASKVGLTENPPGCKKGSLVNERLVERGVAVPVVYKDRGELKYERRIQTR